MNPFPLNSLSSQKVFLFILVVSSFLQLAMLTSGHNWGGDFAAYIMQAMSVVNGTAQEFVQQNRFSMEQSSEAVGPVTYPWLFALLLAPVYGLVGLNVFAMKTIGVLCYQLLLLSLWFGFRHRLNFRDRIIIVALFAFNPFLLRFANQILSDLPFLLFSTTAVLLIDRVACSKRQVMLWQGVLAGLLVASAMLTRSNGILLLPLLITAFMWRRAYIPLVSSLLMLGSMVTLTVSMLPDAQNSYVDHLTKISVRSILENLQYYAVLMQDFFAPSSRFRWMGMLVYLCSLPMLGLGVWYHWRSHWTILSYMAMTLGLYVLWPYMQGLRFLFPVIPFYLYFCLLGLGSVTRLLPSAHLPLQGVVILLACLFFSVSAFYGIQNHMGGKGVEDGPFTEDASQLFAYIRQHSSEDEVVVFRKPRVMRLMTERDALMYRNFEDFGVFDLIVIDRKNEGDQLDLHADLDLLEQLGVILVYQNAQFDVYRRLSS